MNTSSMNRFFVRTYFVFKRFMARLFEKPKFILEAADTLMFKKKKKLNIFIYTVGTILCIFLYTWRRFYLSSIREKSAGNYKCHLQVQYLFKWISKDFTKNMDRLKLWLLYRENITSDPCCTCFGSAYTKYT